MSHDLSATNPPQELTSLVSDTTAKLNMYGVQMENFANCISTEHYAGLSEALDACKNALKPADSAHDDLNATLAGWKPYGA